ncbi:hypothetical protein F5Y14DRAFT_45169 [Nemania sp. NC0429]|nr:hypothetical protein F5Y14DRAFT_45169 [Nemania sp. NC0429]
MTNLVIGNFDDGVAIQLGTYLWSWELCDHCRHTRRNPCLSIDCASTRLRRATRFFSLYRTLVQEYEEASPERTRVFETHGDLFRAIEHLKNNPSITRAELCGFIASPSARSNESDMMHATCLLVKVLAMLDCSALGESPGRTEKGISGISWQDNTPFDKYLQDVFPTQHHPVWSSFQSDDETLVEMKWALRALELREVLKLEFQPTHDIRNHLKLNRQRNELQIFHFASFLKENLRATKLADGLAEKSTGHLPRQLLLEVLDSTQQILFPLHDAKTRQLLDTLIENHGFDPDILRYESTDLRSLQEENLQYVYFANRLSELYNEVQDPSPQTWLDKQLERRSSARYMMLATLVGVLLALLLGIAALTLSAVQTWITYQAWKHPVPQPGT